MTTDGHIIINDSYNADYPHIEEQQRAKSLAEAKQSIEDFDY